MDKGDRGEGRKLWGRGSFRGRRRRRNSLRKGMMGGLKTLKGGMVVVKSLD